MHERSPANRGQRKHTTDDFKSRHSRTVKAPDLKPEGKLETNVRTATATATAAAATATATAATTAAGAGAGRCELHVERNRTFEIHGIEISQDLAGKNKVSAPRWRGYIAWLGEKGRQLAEGWKAATQGHQNLGKLEVPIQPEVKVTPTGPTSAPVEVPMAPPAYFGCA